MPSKLFCGTLTLPFMLHCGGKNLQSIYLYSFHMWTQHQQHQIVIFIVHRNYRKSSFQVVELHRYGWIYV